MMYPTFYSQLNDLLKQYDQIDLLRKRIIHPTIDAEMERLYLAILDLLNQRQKELGIK